MEQSIHDNDYKELEEKVKKFRRAERVSDNSVFILLFLIFLPPVIAIIIASTRNFILPTYSAYPLFGFGFILGLSVIRWKDGQLRLYKVESAEWLNYYIYPAATNLQKYLFNKNISPSMKEKCRKKAIKYLDELVTAVKKRWTVGDFKPAIDAIGTSVSDLLNGLNLWAIPTLEITKQKEVYLPEDTIMRVDAFITSLYWLSKQFSLKGLEDTNSTYKGNYTIPSKEEEKSLWERIKSSKSTKWIAPTVAVVAVFFLSVEYLIVYQAWSIVEAYTAVGAFFAVTLAAVALFRKERD